MTSKPSVAASSTSTRLLPPRSTTTTTTRVTSVAPKPSSSSTRINHPLTPTTTTIKTTSTTAASTLSSSKAVVAQQQRRTVSSVRKPTSSLTVVTQQEKPLYDLNSPNTVYISQNIPIMFTAPHGTELYRFKTSGNRIVHKREQFTTELALLLSQRVSEILFKMWTTSFGKKDNDKPEISQRQQQQKKNPENDDVCSFCVWNCVTALPISKHPQVQGDLNYTDPNYTFKNQFEKSPWNLALRRFKSRVQLTSAQNEKGNGITIIPLHIDLHGKINRKDNFDLDVGMDSFIEFLGKQQPQISSKMFQSCRENFLEAMKKCPTQLHGFSAGVESQPYLSGLWGCGESDPYTMTTQAVLLGLPSFQLEIPLTMRHALMADKLFFEAFAMAFAKIFLAIQEKPPQIVLEGIFGVSSSTTTTKEKEETKNNNIVIGKSLVKQMLYDCEKKPNVEKTQI
jgi:hypothetical protein